MTEPANPGRTLRTGREPLILALVVAGAGVTTLQASQGGEQGQALRLRSSPTTPHPS